MRARLKVSRAGVELIKSFEGLRTTAARLPDGRWTLGYGHTFSARDGATVTQEDADALLRFDLLPIVDAINNLVLVPLDQNQFDALVSFCFNIGVDNFAASTVLKRINEGRMTEAALAMDSWRSAEFNGQTYVLAPLIRRRAAEKNLFLTPEDVTGNAPSLLVRPVEDAADAPTHPSEIEAPAPGGILSARPLGQPEAAPAEAAPTSYTPPFEISATPDPIPAPVAPQPVAPAERQVIDLGSFAPRPQDIPPAKPTIQLVADVAPSVPSPGVVEQSPTAYDYDPTPAMSPEVQAALFRAQEEQRAAEALAQEQRLQEEARRQAEALAAARLAEEARLREDMRRREEERLQELQRQELLRLETERLERERLDRERQERERAEREAQMRAELARLEQERLEQERAERERLEAVRAEAIRLDAERLDRERQEAVQREQARLEAERLEAARLDAIRLEAARLEAERLDRERQEAARLEAERAQAARLEQERLEQERLERERQEAAQREQEDRARREAEAAERARAETARLEQARQERERQERERQLQAAAAVAKPAEDADAEKARKAEAAAALMRLYSPYGGGALGKPLTPQPAARTPEPAPQPVQPVPVPPAQPQAVVTPKAPEPVRLSVPEPEQDDEEPEFTGGASFTPFQPVQSPSTMPPPTVTALNPYARPIQKADAPRESPRDVLVEVPRPAPVNPAAPSNAPFADAQPQAQVPHWREQLNRPLPDSRPAVPEQTSFMQASAAQAVDSFADDEWTFDGDRVALSNEDAEEEHASWWKMIVSTAWWILFSCFGLGLLGFAAAAYWRSAYDQTVLREGHQTDLMMLSVVMAAAGIFFVCVSVWLILKRLGGLKD